MLWEEVFLLWLLAKRCGEEQISFVLKRKLM